MQNKKMNVPGPRSTHASDANKGGSCTQVFPQQTHAVLASDLSYTFDGELRHETQWYLRFLGCDPVVVGR